MAGVGEAAAIVSLVGTAATLSKAVVDIASKYKNARKQIEFFGREVGVLGNVWTNCTDCTKRTTWRQMMGSTR